MATATSKNSNNSPKASQKASMIPPEERFWKRYSAHHEFPLSLSSSLFLHLIGPGILIGIGIVLVPFFASAPLPVDTIVIAGGGGNPEGSGNERGDLPVPSGAEANRDNTAPPETPSKSPETAKLVKPEVQPAPLTQDLNQRLIDLEPSGAGKRLNEVGKRAEAKLQEMFAGKGQGGPGKGGGKGAGEGTGEGNDKGPGKANMTQRQKRQMRWIMIFNTRDGNDYLRQLQGLGAILAVPDQGGNYLVIRDLRQRPVQPQPEDLNAINRIYWIDDKPQSVASLSMALGIQPPSHIVAFFPVELENELLKKEMAAFRGREDDIKETYFRVEIRRGGRYEPVVSEVKRR